MKKTALKQLAVFPRVNSPKGQRNCKNKKRDMSNSTGTVNALDVKAHDSAIRKRTNISQP